MCKWRLKSTLTHGCSNNNNDDNNNNGVCISSMATRLRYLLEASNGITTFTCLDQEFSVMDCHCVDDLAVGERRVRIRWEAGEVSIHYQQRAW